jgi:hypothetical protein
VWSSTCGQLTPDAAKTACKILGYDGGARIQFPGTTRDRILFSNERQPIALAKIDCNGDETSLGECRTAGTDTAQCSTSGVLGVQVNMIACANEKGAWSAHCLSYTDDTPFFPSGCLGKPRPPLACKSTYDSHEAVESWSRYMPIVGILYMHVAMYRNTGVGCKTAAAPSEGAVRLIDGFGGLCDDLHAGIVEIYHEGRWGAVCSTYLRYNAPPLVAQVVCKQLGFPYGTLYNGRSIEFRDDEPYYGGYYDEGPEESMVPSELYWLDEIQCKGTEERLRDCYLYEGFFEREGNDCHGGSQGRMAVACRKFPVIQAFEGDSAGGEGAIVSEYSLKCNLSSYKTQD